MRFLPARRPVVPAVVAATTLCCALIGGALYSRLNAQPRNEITNVAPGLTLQSVETMAPTGPLRFWIVKADRKLMNLGLEVADPTNVVKKRSVRNLAAQSNSLVAINGGFFAYGGAAVGAVKVNGEWQRLPWRNRTSMGWSDSAALIAPLKGELQIDLRRGNQSLARGEAALNGFNLPGQRTAIVNGFALLSPRFKPIYTLQNGETAATIQSGKVGTFYANGAQILLGAQDYLLVARGTMAPLLTASENAPDNLRGKVQSTPDVWDKYPTIVGAGPRLIANGQVQTNEREEEFLPDVIARGPRSAVGWDKDKNWLFLVADGRQAASVGLTIPEMAILFAQMGAVEAMNLDGGSSTQLIIHGELVNTPSGFDPVNPTRPREVQVTNALTLKSK